MKRIVLGLIRFYQKHLSSRKGFHCAYHIVHGGDTCSNAVWKIVADKGLLKGLPQIRRRFRECVLAAQRFRSNDHLILDCDPSCGCEPPDCSGCADVGGIEGCWGGGEVVTAAADATEVAGSVCFISDVLLFLFGSLQAKLVSLLLTLCLFVGGGYFTYGNRVSKIQIKLLNPELEDKDKKFSLVANSELPDYRLILTIDGETVRSNTLHNKSAARWLTFQIEPAFLPSDITRLEVVNRQLFKSKTLEVIENPNDKKQGEIFEYEMQRRWDIF